MAVTVAADNNRIEDCEATTGWINISGGGGIALEPDIVYSGTFAASRKVSTSTLGRGYVYTNDGGTAVDMTATDRRHILYKATATNAAALQTRSTPALQLIVGTGSGAYYRYNVAGSDNYPAKGGWLLIPISPNVTGYRDVTTGSPGALTACDFFGIIGDFTASSKAENLAVDALDIGAGLTLTGGTPDGVWDDFVSHDQGTQTNRYGYVTESQGILGLIGRMAIGENTSGTAVATQFDDTGVIAVWANGYAETGYHELKFNLGGSGTTIDHTGCTFISTGEYNNTVAEAGGGYSTTEDTRTNLTITGTTGTATLTGTVFNNFSDVTLTTATTVDSCDIECFTFDDGGGAEIFDSIIRTTSLTNTATYTDPTFGTSSDLRDTEFIQAGAGHAIELTTSTTRNFTGLNFTGYGADASSSAALFINLASGSITINVTGGSTPTYRLPGGSTCSVTINNSVNVVLNGIITSPSSRLYIEATDSVGSVTDGDALVNAVATDPYTYVHNYEGDLTFLWRVRNASGSPVYKTAEGTGTITSSGATINVTQNIDE